MKRRNRAGKVTAAILISLSVLLIGLSFGSKRVYTEVEINAPSQKVWAIISDLEAYQKWNPFMTEAHGELAAGEVLQMKLHNGSLNLDPFEPKLLKVQEGSEINWLGRVANIPRIFDGSHHLVIQTISDGRVKFIQYEDFQGVGVTVANLFAKNLFADTEEGFMKMNAALKQRAEQMP